MSSRYNKLDLEHLFEDNTEDSETFKCTNRIFSPGDYYTEALHKSQSQVTVHDSDCKYSVNLKNLLLYI